MEALLDKPRKERRPSRSRSRSRRPQRTLQSPPGQWEYSTPTFSYPPQEWFGQNFQSAEAGFQPAEATLAITDSPPGDLRADAADFTLFRSTFTSTTTAPYPDNTTFTPPPAATLMPPPPPPLPPPPPPMLPPPTFPPLPPVPCSHDAIPSSSNKPPPKVIEPSLSPFKPVAGSLLGFLQRATHASIPPPSSLLTPAPSNLLNDVKLNHKGEAKSYPAQEPSEDDLAYAVRLANSIPLNYDWPPLGQVPPSPVPKGLFYPFEFAKLRTMAQRKQYTQRDFERSQEFTAEDLTRWPMWLHDLLSTHGEVHEHSGKVVETLSRIMHTLKYQPASLISWAKSYQTLSGRTVWMLRTRNFPGPNLQKATADEYYQFFHMTSAQGLLGILKTGVILPSATDRMSLPEDWPVSAFFNLLKRTREPMSTEEVAAECASLYNHSKQQSGIMLSGCILGGHTKYPWSSTWVELNLASRAGLVRSKAQDKRWAIRVDLAKIDWIVVMS